MLSEKKIAIIGTGNLGSSVARGLIKNNFPAENLTTTDKKIEYLENLNIDGISKTTDNKIAVQHQFFFR